jgi:hypothetical protein
MYPKTILAASKEAEIDLPGGWEKSEDAQA